LEAAASARAVRPRAYLELARLRLAEAQAHPAEGGRLSADQTATVLQPLFTARSQPPPLPEVYEAIAETWSVCSVTPGESHLAVIDEGVRYFPRNAALVYQDAALKVRSGLIAEAGSLINLGLRIAADGPTRAKFESLKANLPPVPAAAKP
jgi:hypothetical protein